METVGATGWLGWFGGELVAALLLGLGFMKSPSERGAGRKPGVPGKLPWPLGPWCGDPAGIETTSGDAFPEGLLGPQAGLEAGVDTAAPAATEAVPAGLRLATLTSTQSSGAAPLFETLAGPKLGDLPDWGSVSQAPAGNWAAGRDDGDPLVGQLEVAGDLADPP
mmetsp:Transcript_21369/g.49692  ORF Transcript_21369/g.49692 Transcript_21369/m.49692 type:complete len:165 (+) Transcript_21369:999-1493(+)